MGELKPYDKAFLYTCDACDKLRRVDNEVEKPCTNAARAVFAMTQKNVNEEARVSEARREVTRHYIIINRDDMIEYEFIVENDGSSFVYDTYEQCLIRIREVDVYKSIKDLRQEKGRRLVFKANLCA